MTQPRQCPECGQHAMVLKNHREETQVAGIKVLDCTQRVWTCEACGEQDITSGQMRRYERRAAQVILREAKVRDEQVGVIVRYARKALGLTQQELATLLDVAGETISRWENGHGTIPDRATRLAILALLDNAEQGTFDRMREALREKELTKQLEVRDGADEAA